MNVNTRYVSTPHIKDKMKKTNTTTIPNNLYIFKANKTEIKNINFNDIRTLYCVLKIKFLDENMKIFVEFTTKFTNFGEIGTLCLTKRKH